MRKGVFALILLLSGCQMWGPTWSEVTGAPYPSGQVYLYRRPAVIEQVDGTTPVRAYYMKIEPGVHRLVIGGPAPRWPGPNLKDFTLNAEPCKRYYINAQFENDVQPDFKPVIDYVEQIPGCQTTVASK